MRRAFGLLLAFVFLFAAPTEARGYFSAASGSFNMTKVEKNGVKVFEYSTPTNLLLNPDIDQIQTLFKKVAESLNAVLVWDEANKTIRLIKPNVQMITANLVGKDEKGNLVIYGPFGKVKQGSDLERFFVYTEISQLPKEAVELRLVVESPGSGGTDSGKFVVTPGSAVSKNNDSKWITFEVSNPDFSAKGVYRLKLQMKWADGKYGNVYHTIGEKSIRVD